MIDAEDVEYIHRNAWGVKMLPDAVRSIRESLERETESCGDVMRTMASKTLRQALCAQSYARLVGA